MPAATEKVLEIVRRKHNGLTPAEMAADLATEGWQRKQGDQKKRVYQIRSDDKKIKEVKKGKSNIGENAEHSQSLMSLGIAIRRKRMLVQKGKPFPAEKQPDTKFHDERPKPPVREEVDLQELAKATLRSYVGKAVKSADSAFAKRDHAKAGKRAKGINKALVKLHGSRGS